MNAPSTGGIVAASVIRPSVTYGQRRRTSSGSAVTTVSAATSHLSPGSADATEPGRTRTMTSSVSPMSCARGDGLRSHFGRDTRGA